MIKYILILILFAFNSVFGAELKKDSIIHLYYREMYPYNKTDTSFYNVDTVLYHHWPVGYYYKDDHLYMQKDAFPYFNMTKDSMIVDSKDRINTDRVIVITCDSQIVKAIEYYNFEEEGVHPFKFINEKTGDVIHNICQIIDWELSTWRQEKEKRIKNPVYN